ncbi:hypothetical protein MUP95_09875, partial [bacterium]|nr:hypothetical protein [bacterium]
MMQRNDIYNTIRTKLHQLRQKEKVLALITGSLYFLIICLGIILLLSLLEVLFRFSSTVRIVFFIGYVICALGAFGFWIFKPLFSIFFKTSFPDDDNLALQIGHYFPEIKDRLADAIQVFRLRDDKIYGTSSSLAQASLQSMYEEVKSFDFR